MKRFPTQIAWVSIIATATFIALLTLIGNEFAVRLENYVGMALALAVIYQYRREALDGLILPRPTGFQVFALGAILIMLSTIVRNFYSSLDRDFHIGWVRWGPVVPVFLFLMLLGSVLKIFAPSVEEGWIKLTAFIRLLKIFALGVVIALAITGWLYLRP